MRGLDMGATSTTGSKPPTQTGQREHRAAQFTTNKIQVGIQVASPRATGLSPLGGNKLAAVGTEVAILLALLLQEAGSSGLGCKQLEVFGCLMAFLDIPLLSRL